MSQFVDEAGLHVKGGDGGAGAVSFRREAHTPRGGPDGGDGGKGGDVWLVADQEVASLSAFRDHPHRRAASGAHGMGKARHGASGDDLRVLVPEGTVVKDANGVVLADLASAGDQEQVLLTELGRYQPELLERPRLLVGTKADVASVAWDGELRVSAVTGAGLPELLGRMARAVVDARASRPPATAYVVHRPVPEGVRVERAPDGALVVLGASAERAVAVSDVTDHEALAYVRERLRRAGVDRALARAGAREGDQVRIGAITFEYGSDDLA